ncbi:putative ABC transport system permease protein [Anaerosporobacter mobilis DSM 15930]|uniref:Putative ABC transport system permease protein n=1 Tax=Anaerosporobacter mobilis DSM 15930 TaxID=1120996 RepID=A0A1M7KS00_9FIRM|nr:ABC transporter permease [Anaerosporobacter mobilis]SHM67965.1 putative ABC transport system permease protein [Anaerosporobacter mobilis DSM 15930]
MGKSFYLKLAVTNLKKNRNAYIPYILAGMGMVFTYVLFLLLSEGKGITNVVGAETLQIMFEMGAAVISIFSVIFIFYANGFLMKRRKKEIALYGILGLERKHVGLVMLYESLIAGLISVISGMVLGLLFGKLFFMLLMKITRIAEGSKFIIDTSVFTKTFLFFMAVYLATLLWNQLQVRLSKPIELLKGEEIGQKEKRSTPILAIIGLGLLAAGYYMALNIVNPLAAINRFFIAVLLVIAGTYYTFRAGSIVILKLLKKNKRYYYQTNHFITVSGMIHRMKQNATGLANICILSTMVLVTLSTTIALFVGQEKMIEESNPTDYYLNMEEGTVSQVELKETVYEVAQKHNVTISNYKDIRIKGAIASYSDGTMKGVDREIMLGSNSKYYSVIFIPLTEYNKLTGKNVNLEENEVLMSFAIHKSTKKNVKVLEENYTVKGACDDIGINMGQDVTAYDSIYMVFKNENRILDIVMKMSEEFTTNSHDMLEYNVYFDAEGEYEDRLACAGEMKEVTYNMVKGRYFANIDLSKEDGYKLFGGLVFLGFFLGIIFLLAMVMIIYFKQISEGFEDRKRFEILNKVGLDKKDVKKTINKQIIQVFFLPLLGAIIHVAFAFKMITKLLLIFNLSDTSLIFYCTLITIAIFAVIYIFVFKMTAKAYYRIVNR